MVGKKKCEMVVWRGASGSRAERIALRREPAGRYTVDRRKAWSKYHLPLHISYLDAADVARAREAGRRRGHHDPRLAGRGTDGGRLDAGGNRGDGRGNGRDLGAGGGGHGDPESGMRKRTQSIRVFSVSYWVRLVFSVGSSLSWVRTPNSRVSRNGVRSLPGLPIAKGMRRWCGMSSQRPG